VIAKCGENFEVESYWSDQAVHLTRSQWSIKGQTAGLTTAGSYKRPSTGLQFHLLQSLKPPHSSLNSSNIHNTGKMSAVQDARDVNEPLQVLFPLHDDFDTLDFVGPMEMFSNALHDQKNKGMKLNWYSILLNATWTIFWRSETDTKAFNITIAAAKPAVKSAQGLTVKADIDLEDAVEDIEKWDIIVIPGGGVEGVLTANTEPMNLIKEYVKLQESDPSKERTLFSVCTGSLFLAQAGVLQGLAATTHPDYYLKLELACQEAARMGNLERTDVMEERYVVNNARFDLGDKWEENPFILDQRPDPVRRKSSARKGSESYRLSKRRESLVKRATMRLGGMRVITSGGVTAGMDAALYLVAALVSIESANEVARLTQFQWQKGVTCEGIDV
jgi:transcriptional regulator GlxA family with amidase domain